MSFPSSVSVLLDFGVSEYFPIVVSGKMGTQVIIPYREEDDKRHLKLTGDLGQIVSMVCSNLSQREFGAHSLFHRNGTFAMNNRLKNVSDTLTSFTTL